MKTLRVSELPSPAPPSLGHELDFLRIIWALDHALQHTSKRMEASLGVTGPQRMTLRIIGRFPGIPAGHLARLLYLHPSTLTGIVRRLERRGLLRKRRDPHDGRRVLLSLSKKGRSFDFHAEGTVEAAVHRAIARTVPRNVAAAREVLQSLAHHLGQVEP